MSVSVGDGVSIVLVQPNIFRGPVQPESGVRVGDLWIDTSGGTPVLKQCNSIAPVTFVAVDTGGGGGGGGGIAIAAGTQTATTNTVVLANSNGISFGMSGSTRITASYTVPTLTEYVFSNSNNVSFGTNGSTVTATASFNQSVQPALQSLSAGTTRITTGEVVFSNSNGLSFGVNGNTVTASYTVPTQTQFVLSNSNGISFGTNGSTVTASYTVPNVPAQTVQTLGLYAVSNTTGQSSSSTFDARSLSFQGAGVASVGYSNGSVVVSVPAGGGAGDGYNILAAGTQTATTAGTVAFVDSNGITFGMSGSTRITASHNGITQQSTQPVAISGSNGSFAFSTVSFGNSNNFSFYTTNGSVVGSYTVPTVTNSSWTVSDNGTSGTVGRLAFTNLNGVTLSLSTGAGGSHTIVGSHNGLTSQSNQAFSAQGGSSAFQTLVFTNSNGISFSNTNGSIWASHNALTTARASNDGIGLNTAQSNVTWTVNSSGLSLDARGYAGTGTTFNGANVSGSMTLNSNGLNLSLSAGAGGGVTPVASASNGSFSFTTLAFSNANNVTFGTSAGSIITASVAPPGAAAEENWHHLLGANTAGNTTASGSTIGLSGINLTMSGTNGSVINISAPATSSLVGVSPMSISTNGSTISVILNQVAQSFFRAIPDNGSTAAAQVGNGSIAVYPVIREGNFTATRADIMASFSVSSSSNSSHAGALSVYVGMYTRNGSTLSLASSGSQSYQWTNTSNNSLGSIASLRRLSVPMDVDYQENGDIWVAVMTRSSTTNANWFTASNILVANAPHTAQVVGLIGEASNGTRGLLGLGRYSASSTVLPASMAFSHISGGVTASISKFSPNVYFANFTA